MNHIKWQRMVTIGVLLLAAAYPAGEALAAPAAAPSHSGDFTSCQQSFKDVMGVVVPSLVSEESATECILSGSTNSNLIPLTGDVSGILTFRDVGASAGLLFSSTGGWRDAGAGSR